MKSDIQQNYAEKLRIVVTELLSELDQNIKLMLAEHSRDGNLGSGDTIKKTMEYISAGNARFYQKALDHLFYLSPEYHQQLESEIQGLAKPAQNSFKQEALQRLKKSTEIARSPNLYERMLPDIESSMATDFAHFQNSLNSAVIALNQQQNPAMSAMTKVLWALEAILLTVSVIISGMWFNDPEGNYEPILVGLGLVIPLIAVGIKLSAKK